MLSAMPKIRNWPCAKYIISSHTQNCHSKFRRGDFKETLENLHLDHYYLIHKFDSNVGTTVQLFGDEIFM